MKASDKGIKIEINGDSGPFSKIGKSIGYRIVYKDRHYLIDCGAPVFQSFGIEGIRNLSGIFITHSHDDHKRWYTDMALYKFYTPGKDRQLTIMATETTHEELAKSSMAALTRSLNFTSDRIVELPYEAFINRIVVGPRAKYCIKYYKENSPTGHFAVVVDSRGRPVNPKKAKVVMNKIPGSRPRLLFKDPSYNEWIEPEAFYSFNASVFYSKSPNIYKDPKVSFEVTALKAPCWHGPPTVAYQIRTPHECVSFGSDTLRDLALWERLYSTKHKQKLSMSRADFEKSPVIYGDINNYIERMWSRQRYDEAVHAYDEGLCIHDVATRNSVVHTDYPLLESSKLDRSRTILTHSPDIMVSEWILTQQDKIYRIIGKKSYEQVGNELFPLNADIYFKDVDKFFAGYENPRGKYKVYEKDGVLGITKTKIPTGTIPRMRVDLYQDIKGHYFPISEKKNQFYIPRPDGKIELVTQTARGSIGKLVPCQRKSLST